MNRQIVTAFLLVALVFSLIFVMAFSLISRSEDEGTVSVPETASETESAAETVSETESAAETADDSPMETETDTTAGSESETESRPGTDTDHVHTPTVIAGVPATCRSAGATEGKICADCGWILVAPQAVERLPHTEEDIPGTAPTCTTAGLSAGRRCAACGEILLAQGSLAPAGHTFSAWQTATAPTETAEGVRVRLCTVCRHTEVEKIPALGADAPPRVDLSSEITLRVGETRTLVPQCFGTDANVTYVWYSDDPSVAVVKPAGGGLHGNVTGVSAGSTVVMVITSTGLSASCRVTVEAADTPVAIRLPNTLEICEGVQMDLDMTVEPAGASVLFEATSSDPSVLTVATYAGQSGVRIYGIRAGSATVTVSTADGISATCTVTVTAGTDPESIAVPVSHQMTVGDAWVIPVTLSPDGSMTLYAVATSDPAVVKATTASGHRVCRVYALAVGTATVTVSTENGLTATCTVTVVE